MQSNSLVSDEDYLGLLELAFEVAQSLAGVMSDDSRLPDCQQLAVKLYFHAASIHLLSKGTNVPVPRSRVGSSFFDSPSIAVLTRAALETYLTMFEVFFEPQSEDEFEFSHALWKLAGFVVREDHFPSDPDLEVAYVQAQADIQTLRDRISATAKFKSLTSKQRKQVLAGRRLRHRMDVADAAGFGQEFIGTAYRLYSDYAHSGGLSAAQVVEAKSAADQQEQIELHLVTTGIVLSKMILDYATKFDEARQACSRFKPAYEKAIMLSKTVSLLP